MSMIITYAFGFLLGLYIGFAQGMRAQKEIQYEIEDLEKEFFKCPVHEVIGTSGANCPQCLKEEERRREINSYEGYI